MSTAQTGSSWGLGSRIISAMQTPAPQKLPTTSRPFCLIWLAKNRETTMAPQMSEMHSPACAPPPRLQMNSRA